MKKHLILSLLACILAAEPVAHAAETSFEEDHSLPVVEINVAVKTGAESDPKSALGVTNFMGEMLLRGTKRRNKQQIDLAIDQMGAQLSVEARSGTMILRGAVLSSQLDPFLALLTEILTEPSFPEREISHLKSEVVSQILDEMGSDRELAGRKFTETLFKDHPYGKPILGMSSTINHLTRTDIEKQYQALITDKQLLVVGTGDTQAAKISAWAEQLGQTLKHSGQSGSDVKIATPQEPTSRELIIVDKPNRTQTQITGGQIGIRMTDPSFFPLYLGNQAFGGGSFSARLMQEVRVKRGWSYGAYSYFKHSKEPRSWQFYLFPAAKDTPSALALTLKLTDDVREKGITPEEFDFAQKSLINGAGFMFDTPKKRVENKLLERTLDLPDGFMKTYAAELTKVTLPQVNTALHDFLDPKHFLIVVVGTASELKTPLTQAAGVTPEHVKVVPYTQE